MVQLPDGVLRATLSYKRLNTSTTYIFILWIRFDGGALWYPLGIAFLFGVATFIFA